MLVAPWTHRLLDGALRGREREGVPYVSVSVDEGREHDRAGGILRRRFMTDLRD
jgi:hypothetical protein